MKILIVEDDCIRRLYGGHLVKLMEKPKLLGDISMIRANHIKRRSHLCEF